MHTVSAHAHHHRVTGGMFFYSMEDQEPFFVGQGGRFSRRSQGNQEIDARLHLAFCSGNKGLYVNLSVAERGKHSRSTAF